MALVGTLNTFSQGQTSAPSDVNSNFTDLKAGINSISHTQIDAASTIMLTSANKTITGTQTFGTNPVFNAGGIADASLTSNVALLNGTQEFTGALTVNTAITGFKVPTLQAHPTGAGDNNEIYEYTDGNIYIYKHGTGVVRLDYVGAYVGGAPRPYNGELVVDENTPGYIKFKCDAGFTTVNLALTGKDFPSYIYTELAQHAHGSGTLALSSGTVNNTDHTHVVNITSHAHDGTFGSSNHTHTGDGHTHLAGSLVTASTGGHNHGGTTGSIAVGIGVGSHNHTITSESNHNHGISGNVASDSDTTGGPSATASVSSTTIGNLTSGNPTYGTPASVGTALSGTLANAGILGNALNDTKKLRVTNAIKIYITQDMGTWGTGYDSGTYGALANIDNDNGTGDIDVTAKCVAGYNYIKVVDETAKKGGTIIYHLESS